MLFRCDAARSRPILLSYSSDEYESTDVISGLSRSLRSAIHKLPLRESGYEVRCFRTQRISWAPAYKQQQRSARETAQHVRYEVKRRARHISKKNPFVHTTTRMRQGVLSALV